MSSSAENKKCICLGSVATGQGQAIFTAECSHSFHVSCISNYLSNGSHHCPFCHVKWTHLPFTMPFSNTNFNYRNRVPYQPPPFSFPQVPLPPFPPCPVFEPEPLRFCDDESLPAVAADPMLLDSLVGSRKVTIKAVPERPAVAASESISVFTLLVGLKAPSLSDDARCSQRASIDIVAVLDVSGSMAGKKLDLLKQAVHFVIDNLGISDRLSIVSFSDRARRVLPLRRMTENGREDAKRAVNSLSAVGGTNIVEGLRKGAQVIGERRYKNSVTSIIFLSDGNDTYNHRSFSLQAFPNSRDGPGYLHLLPASIYPKNGGLEAGQLETIPVHSFGFGSDHDPITMHAIADASGGTFSFIESYQMIQDAFASCIGGLLSVVAQELRLKVRSASHGVEIKSIPSGRYASEISNQGSQGLINVGDLYADEEKEFLINLSVPALPKDEGDQESERKTSLLDIICSYRDAVSKDIVVIESDLVDIRRPRSLSAQDMVINLEVDRQRNRLYAAESIQQAQQMAEAGNLAGAQSLLANKRTELLASASAQARDSLCMWLEADMQETGRRMASPQVYQQSGRAYALAGMSSHALQRATTKGHTVAGAAPVGSISLGAAPAAPPPCPYATPNMANMVFKSQQLNKTGEDNIVKKE